MSEQVIQLGWLKDFDGIKFAPKTFAHLLLNEDGSSFINLITNKIDSKPGQITSGTLYNIKHKGSETPIAYLAHDNAVIHNDLSTFQYLTSVSNGYLQAFQINYDIIGNAAIGKYAFVEGSGNIALQENAHAEGKLTFANGYGAHAEGIGTYVEGIGSHVEGIGSQVLLSDPTNQDIIDYGQHAEGVRSLSQGTAAHAEGWESEASGLAAHSEGSGTKASGDNAHAEGGYTNASGTNSHAEGQNTKAKGINSHAGGLGTTAQGNNSHVTGKYNTVDNENRYAHIVGNGTSDSNRSNAYTLDWNGNAWFAGEITASQINGNITSADKLNCYLSLNGQKFDGSANVTISTLQTQYGGTGTNSNPTPGGIIYGATATSFGCTLAGKLGDILMSDGNNRPKWHTPTSAKTPNTLMLRDSKGNVSVNSLTIEDRVPAISFISSSYNYLLAPADGSIALCCANASDLESSSLVATSAAVLPGKNSAFTLGNTKCKWSNVYADTFTGAMSTSINVNGKSYNGSTDVDVGVIDVTYGGTGKSSWAANGLLYASSTSTLSQISTGANGQYLRSGGSSAAPVWSNTIVVQVNPSTTPTEVGAIWITT